MATQGLVSIMQGGKVAMKIVAGFNGMKARSLVGAIRKLNRLPSVDEAYDLALAKGFGSPECLVVITDTEVKHAPDEELHERYRKTFSQPLFNPRWEQGTAAHVASINL